MLSGAGRASAERATFFSACGKAAGAGFAAASWRDDATVSRAAVSPRNAGIDGAGDAAINGAGDAGIGDAGDAAIGDAGDAAIGGAGSALRVVAVESAALAM